MGAFSRVGRRGAVVGGFEALHGPVPRLAIGRQDGHAAGVDAKVPDLCDRLSEVLPAGVIACHKQRRALRKGAKDIEMVVPLPVDAGRLSVIQATTDPTAQVPEILSRQLHGGAFEAVQKARIALLGQSDWGVASRPSTRCQAAGVDAEPCI